MHDACLCRELGELEGRLRDGEIEKAVDEGKKRKGIIGDSDAKCCDPRQGSDIGPGIGRAPCLDRACDLAALGLMNDARQHAAHASAGAGDGELHRHHTPSTITISASPALTRLALAAWYSGEL